MKKLNIVLFLLLSTVSLNAQTPERGFLTDIEGNVYQTIVIGHQEWMAENLKTTTYNNGTKIPTVTENSEWLSLSSGAYCWYKNDESHSDIYGAFYNWFAVNTGMLCPDGWRVPTDDEWKYLEAFADTKYGIGDPVWDKSGFRGQDAGQGLMSRSGWKLDKNGTNVLGFTALPGGERLKGSHSMGSNGFWWTSTENDATSAWFRGLIYGMEDISRDTHPKKMGFAVRCLRNE